MHSDIASQGGGWQGVWHGLRIVSSSPAVIFRVVNTLEGGGGEAGEPRPHGERSHSRGARRARKADVWLEGVARSWALHGILGDLDLLDITIGRRTRVGFVECCEGRLLEIDRAVRQQRRHDDQPNVRVFQLQH